MLALSDADVDVQLEASAALANLGETAAPEVAGALGSSLGKDYEERAATLFLLSRPILEGKASRETAKLAELAASDLPTPKVKEFARGVLAGASASERVEAVNGVYNLGIDKRPIPLIVSLSVNDPDARVRGMAAEYLVSRPREEVSFALVAMLGWKDVSCALRAAGALARLKSVGDLLRRTAKGVHPQRRALAAGVLAELDDSAGREVLRKAATGETPLEPPLPGWAAYNLSRLGRGEGADADLFARLAASAQTKLDRTYYLAAAARLGSARAGAELASSAGDRQLPGDVRGEVLRIMADIRADGAREALIEALEGDEVALQVAAAEALARLGDRRVISKLIERMASPNRDLAEAATAAVVSYGTLAEGALVDALDGATASEAQAGILTAMERLGRRGTGTTVKAIISWLRMARGTSGTREIAARALRAVAGVEGQASWTWRDWAKACRIDVAEVTADLAYEAVEWLWLSLEVPKGWRRAATSVLGDGFPGEPAIEVRVTRDPEDRAKIRPQAHRAYQDTTALVRERTREFLTQGGSVRKDVTIDKTPPLDSGANKVSTLRVVDGARKTTTYCLFLVMQGKPAGWYTEVRMTALTTEYPTYADAFENRVAKSFKILTERLN
jgi:hypothetical protein